MLDLPLTTNRPDVVQGDQTSVSFDNIFVDQHAAACKKCVMRCWRVYLSAAGCKWFAYGRADATATPSSLASLNPKWFYLSGAGLPRFCWNTTTITIVLRPFVRDYPGEPVPEEHSPTHHPDHHPTLISFFHLLPSTVPSMFNLRAWQSFCTSSVQVLFGLLLGLEPSTSYSIHFFIQSVSSFRNTYPCHRNLFCCSTKIVSSIPSLSKLCWNIGR